MIKTLQASAHFTVSGATLSGDFQPETGITAVVGENGAGKTFLTIEATRWLLFGKAALRGAASDYKDAAAKGTFTIRGADYEISRGKHEWVKDSSGAIVAKGADKVTEYVTSVLGYGLDVFDLCNAATQGNVQKLGDMRPAERKAIIDKVLRLTDAEKAEKDCREEAKGYKREAETLVKTLRAPSEAPKEPEGYLPSSSARDRLQAMRELRDDHSVLRSQLRPVAAPQKPQVGTFSDEAIAELEVYVEEQRELHRKLRDLTVASEGAKWSLEQLDAAEVRLRARNVRETRGDVPTMTQADVEAGFAEHRAVVAHTASEPVECPNCQHTFCPTGEAPPQPRWSRATLEIEEKRLRAWAGFDPSEPLPDGLDIGYQEQCEARAALKAHTELCALPPLGPDRQGQLNLMRQDKATMEAFLAAQLQFERDRQGNAEVEAKIAALPPCPDDAGIDKLVDEYQAALAYETAREVWQREDAAFKDTQAKIVEANRLADEFKLGATGIADARAVVKALIAPKISRIATVLIRDMSMGKLDNLVVDDEMEITVGGQRIETLSGAGKTVANLALRIAMGRALVGHVFPVFLADEIDGDLSVKRREATLQALVSLKQHLQQIILVTHRGADIADHVVEITG